MQFFKEMNAFREWMLLNEISTSAVALWYTLMSINNSVGWKSRFNAPNSVVQKLTGLSKQGLSDARKKFIDHDLIKYEKGKKGRAPIYQMASLVSSADLSLDSSLAPKLDLSSDKSLTIHRQRLRQERIETDAHEVIHLYEANIGMLSPLGREELLAWREKVSDDLIGAAIELGARNGARSVGYVVRILQEWVANGLETIKDVQAYRQAKANRRPNTIPFRKREKQDYKALFDEIRREG